MEAALAQVGRAGAGERNVGLVAGDDRLDQRAAGGVPVVADASTAGTIDAAAMRRAVAVAVVELDAVRGGAAEEGGVEQVGAPRAAGHRDLAGRPHRLRSPLSAWVAIVPGAPAIITPTVSSRCRRA